MTEPNRTSTGIAYMTFDATLNTNASMIAQQKLDLSGNTTARTFCVNACNLALGRDISGSLLTDSEITDYESNNLVYLGSNDVNVQKTFLSSNINSTKSLNQMCNAYDMTLGKNNQIPIVSYLESLPPFRQITETKIVASDREQASDYFGFSVAIDGNYAIVGAKGDDSNAGSAYILEITDGSWNEVQKIVADDRQASDYFGQSVAISGNYAIVGANGDDSVAGSAYIFEKDTDGSWNEVQKIVANDRTANDLFGGSVAIIGNYAIVGANYKNNGAGSAYIFERNTNGTWNEVQKIVASDIATGDRFGLSVAIDGNYAIVGAYYKDSGVGSAYVFERNTDGTWNQNETQKIVGDIATSDRFGYSVAISGNYAIVGANTDDISRGSAYIFERDTTGNWSQTQKIVASDRSQYDNFGNSVAISGNYAIVGAYNEDQDANGTNSKSDAGSAYIFEKDTDGSWNEVQKIVASDRQESDYFGHSVSISGNYAIVGAFYEDHGANGTSDSTTTDPDYLSAAGSAYIFKG